MAALGGPLALPGGALGHLPELDVTFRADWSYVRRLRTKMSVCPASRGSQTFQQSLAQPPEPLRCKHCLSKHYIVHPSYFSLFISSIVLSNILDITNKTPVFPADKLMSESPFNCDLMQFHILVFLEFFMAVSGVSSSETVVVE